jgi:hypothetical protein
MFREVVAAIQPPITDRRPEAPTITVGIGPDAFSLQGRGFALLEELADGLSVAALKEGGLSHDEAREILLRSCYVAKKEGPDKALASLEASLARPPRKWQVIRPLRAGLPGEPVEIGGCQIRSGLFEELGYGKDWFGADDFPALTVATYVMARDDDSAAILAEQRIAESLGLLHTFDPDGSPTLGEARGMVDDQGTLLTNPDPRRAFHLSMFIGKDGSLPRRLVPASEAAAKTADARTDWERRVIAAARWFSKGMSSAWPSEKLVSLFVALEALFVAGKEEPRDKKTLIANRLTERLAVKGRSQDEAREWIKSLYDRRNDAVHEARDYLDDFEVAELGKVVWRSLHWAMDHLIPEHRRDGRACETFDEVMNCRRT